MARSTRGTASPAVEKKSPAAEEPSRRSGREARKKQVTLPGEDNAEAEAAAVRPGRKKQVLIPDEPVAEDAAPAAAAEGEASAEAEAPAAAAKPKKSALKKPTEEKKQKEEKPAVAHSHDKRTRGFKSAEVEAVAAEEAAAKQAAKEEAGPIEYLDDAPDFEDEDYEDAGALDDDPEDMDWGRSSKRKGGRMDDSSDDDDDDDGGDEERSLAKALRKQGKKAKREKYADFDDDDDDDDDERFDFRKPDGTYVKFTDDEKRVIKERKSAKARRRTHQMRAYNHSLTAKGKKKSADDDDSWVPGDD